MKCYIAAMTYQKLDSFSLIKHLYSAQLCIEMRLFYMFISVMTAKRWLNTFADM